MNRRLVSQIPPDLGAEIPGATHADSPYMRELWHGRAAVTEIPCTLWQTPAKGPWPRLTYWVADNWIVHVTGVDKLPEWAKDASFRVWSAGWKRVSAQLAEVGMTAQRHGERVKRSTKKLTGLRKRIWCAAHALAQSCAASAGDEDYADQEPITERAHRESARVWLRSLSGAALIHLGVACVQRVVQWYQDPRRDMRWYLAQFSTRCPWSGGVKLRSVDGDKTRSCADVLAEAWLRPDSEVARMAQELHTQRTSAPWFRPLVLFQESDDE